MAQQQSARKRETAQPAKPQARLDAPFKPVALPALAAAIHASRARPQPAPRQDVPAILRSDWPTD